VAHRFGAFEIVQRLARRGTTELYLARPADVPDARPVCLQVLLSTAEADPDGVGAWVREARWLAALRHPNVVAFLEAGDIGGMPYLTREHVAGHSLDALYRASEGPSVRIAALLSIHHAVALALHDLHGDGLANGRPDGWAVRDLHAGNILLSARGAPSLVGFGVPAAAPPEPDHAAYRAPELAAGAVGDQRTDLYSLGVSLHRGLTGVLPDAGPRIAERNPAVPARLAAMIEALLSPSPGDRLPSGRAVADVLEEVALAEGWTLGPVGVQRWLHHVFPGDVPEPDGPDTGPITTGARRRARPRPEPVEDPEPPRPPPDRSATVGFAITFAGLTAFGTLAFAIALLGVLWFASTTVAPHVPDDLPPANASR
jgi:serine/threonine protein kinase